MSNNAISPTETDADHQPLFIENWRLWAACIGSAILGGLCAFPVWSLMQPGFVIPAEFERLDGDFAFARWARDSSMQEVDPTTVFVLVNGLPQARFTFRSADFSVVESAGLSDNFGRPWLHVDFAEPRIQINHFAPGDTRVTADPDFTYIDLDGDFFPDERKDWASGKMSCVDAAPQWHECEGR